MEKRSVKWLLFANVIVGLMMCAASSSSAGFGANAFSPSDGTIGYSTGFPSQRNAEIRALNECRKNGSSGCRIVPWERNACAAFAVGNNNGWGAAWHSSRVSEEWRAIALCSDKISACEAKRWVCN